MSVFTKLRNLITAMLLVCTVTGYAQIPPDFNWTKQIKSTGKDYGRALIVNHLGHMYTTGYYQNTGDFGPGVTLTSFGNYDYYLAKYDSLGIPIWAKGGGGTLTDRGQGLVFAPDGNIIVTGHFYGTALFNDSSLTSGGNLDMMTIKYDTSGNIIWIEQGTSTSQMSGYAVDVDAAGNSAVACYFGSATVTTATFGTVTLTSYGNRDAAVVKYDPNGNVLWARNMGGTLSTEETNDVCFDPAGNIYVTGMFNTQATFGTTIVNSNGGTDVFIAKFDPNGNLVWVKNGGGTLADEGNSLVYAAPGFLYVTGTFDSAATFGTFNLTSSTSLAGDQEIFFVKMDVDGNFISAVSGGGNGDDIGEDLFADAAGNIYLTGEFESTATFGTIQLTSAGDDDIFMMKLNSNNDILWVQRAGGTGIDRGYGCTADPGGNFYATGYFNANATFGTTTLTSQASEDIFITKIGHYPVPVELTLFNASVQGNSVTLNWNTATETNNRGFEIERNLNGGTFQLVAFVDGKGTTADRASYSYTDIDLKAGHYAYRLKQVDFDGTFKYSEVVEVEVALPENFILHQNYPNPFNPSTTISFDLPVESKVTLTIFNSLGEEIERLTDGLLSAGRHSFNLNANSLSSGVYVYKIDAAGINGKHFSTSRKMTLIR